MTFRRKSGRDQTYEKTPHTVSGSPGGARRGPVTFTAKSMTLFTATSARSSAIFLRLPPAGSLGLWSRTSRPPLPLPSLRLRPAPPANQPRRCPPPPRQRTNRGPGGEGGVARGSGPMENRVRRKRRDLREGEKDLVKGAWPGTRAKVVRVGRCSCSAAPPEPPKPFPTPSHLSIPQFPTVSSPV